MTTTTSTSSTEPKVPLAVWPCAQVTAQYQRAGRYLPESTRHPGKMLPDLARRIVEAFSGPGDLVVDPMAGSGTTLVEAASLGRRTIGVELEPRWVALARANIDYVPDADQRRLAEVRAGDASRLVEVLDDVAGRVDLVVLSPPYACEVAAIDKPAWRSGRRLADPTTKNYSANERNLGHARGDVYVDAMAEVYAGIHRLLRPGGLLATVTKNLHRQGRLLDLAAMTHDLATRSGLCYLQHIVALHAAIRDDTLVPRPSFWQLTRVRRDRDRDQPAHLVAHEDVLVFRKEDPVDG
ncbi:MAG TPA: DNA methyltransferase [Nitriliruptorales bacterium]